MMFVGKLKCVGASCFTSYFMGVVVGVMVAITTVDHGLLLGREEAWNQVGGDSGVSLAVFRYFLDQGFWSNPFTVHSLGVDGVAVAANDSIPLLAYLARFVSIAFIFTRRLGLDSGFLSSFCCRGRLPYMQFVVGVSRTSF